MTTLQPYTPQRRQEWDAFVGRSKNATFLLQRAYMDYHADRYVDASLMAYDDAGRLRALLPATRHGDEIRSHGGLTYGGLLTDATASATFVLECLTQICDCYSAEGIRTLLYKPVPHIYHTLPAEEDLYALWRLGATVAVRNLSCTVALDAPLLSRRLTHRARNYAANHGIAIAETARAADFWHIIEGNRAAKGRPAPVHTLAEMQMLHDRCPDNIRMLTASAGGEVLGGFVVYLTDTVIHAQYGAFTDTGRRLKAEDVMYRHLIDAYGGGRRWLDFGTSNEEGGRVLNAALSAHKEELGGRGIIYDTYMLTL